MPLYNNLCVLWTAPHLGLERGRRCPLTCGSERRTRDIRCSWRWVRPVELTFRGFCVCCGVCWHAGLSTSTVVNLKETHYLWLDKPAYGWCTRENAAMSFILVKCKTLNWQAHHSVVQWATLFITHIGVLFAYAVCHRWRLQIVYENRCFYGYVCSYLTSHLSDQAGVALEG